MKKVLILVMTIGMSGCSLMPHKNVSELSTPSGKGSLAVATTFYTESTYYPCKNFYLLIEKSIDNLEPKQEKLVFYPDMKANYILFDDMESGQYSIKKIKCFPHTGYVFNNNQKYLQWDVTSQFVIEPNKLTLSKEAFSGVLLGNGRFSVSFDARENNPELLKHVISEKTKAGWSFQDLNSPIQLEIGE